MSAATYRLLSRIANLALVVGILVLLLPWGMRAYGHLSQALKHERLQSSLREGLPEAKQPLVRRPWEPAILKIPAIGLDVAVTEGSWDWKWLSGALHQPGTPGLGGLGNCVLGAHRNMWDAAFADLPVVKKGDRIYATTSAGTFLYKVVSSRELSIRDRKPLKDTKDGRITLYTCVVPHKRDRRWVVQGKLIGPTRPPES